jgi:drug/metabolite transporter (DMT)-like permease
MLVGWYFNNEELSSQSLIAALLMLFGVFFIVSRKAEQEA